MPDRTEEQMEALYRDWLDSGAHLFEGDRYGHERAAFYAGLSAAAAGPRRARVSQEVALAELRALAAASLPAAGTSLGWRALRNVTRYGPDDPGLTARVTLAVEWPLPPAPGEEPPDEV